MPDISNAWIAVIGTVFGGAGLKLVETWLNRSSKADENEAKRREEVRSEANKIREELRILIDGLKADLAAQKLETVGLDAQLEKLRTEYWALMSKSNEFQADLLFSLARLKDRAAEDALSTRNTRAQNQEVVDARAIEDLPEVP